jgi:predicted RNase H-like nuclease
MRLRWLLVGTVFVGVDLAWGDRNRTGLAAIDGAGRLIEVTDRRTDDEIISWLSRHTSGPCLVAIDAPLIVNNPGGRRPCEAQLSAVFGRYDAGAHPSNTAKPWFADGTRGARLASRLGLDIDPASTQARRAIEVYPHPATVVFFGLDRTLKYKHKPGRTLVELQAASAQLLRFIESLESAEPPLRVAASTEWQAITGAVSTATRKSQLRAVEDRIDAVLCAYIALYFARRLADTTTFGDANTGYIITPTLPGDHMTSSALRTPSCSR